PVELPAVVSCDRVHPARTVTEQPDAGVCHFIGAAIRQLRAQQEAALALDQRCQSAAALAALQGVRFPVAEAAAPVDYCRAFMDRDSAGNPATLTGPAALPAPQAAGPQMGVQRSSRCPVTVDVQVDPLVADQYIHVHCRPAADLFRAPVLADQDVNETANRRPDPAFCLALPPLSCQPVGAGGAISTSNAVAPDLPADAGFAAAQRFGDFRLAVI